MKDSRLLVNSDLLVYFLTGNPPEQASHARELFSDSSATKRTLIIIPTAVAFAVAHYGYIMETGKIVLDGPTERLINDQDVREFYLGMSGGEEAKSYRDIKHYKRRKRWLS